MEFTLKNVSLKVKNNFLLKKINLTAHTGDVIGVLGKNGAGKSTLFSIMSTLRQPSTGDVLLDQQSILKRPKLIKGKIGYLSQEVPYYETLSAQEYLNYIAAIKRMPKQIADKQITQLLAFLI